MNKDHVNGTRNGKPISVDWAIAKELVQWVHNEGLSQLNSKCVERKSP